MGELETTKAQLEKANRTLLNTQGLLNKAQGELTDLRKKFAVTDAALDMTTRGLPTQKAFWLKQAEEKLAIRPPRVV